MDYKLSFKLFHTCLLVGFGILIANFFLNFWWLFLIGFGIVVAGIRQLRYFCHCPHCGSVLDIREGKIRTCQHCQGTIDW